MAVDQINGQTSCRLRYSREKRDLAGLRLFVTTVLFQVLVKTLIPRWESKDLGNLLRRRDLGLALLGFFPRLPRGMPGTTLHRAAGNIRRIEMAVQTEPRVFQYAARLIDDEAPAKPRDKPHAPFGKWLRDAALILGDNVLDLLPFRLFPRVILAKSHELFKAQ